MELRFAKTDRRGHVPKQARAGDAGLDLDATEDHLLQPGERKTIGTGVAVEIPEGYAGLVLPRSGLASRHGLTLANAPGLIDAGYRGDFDVELIGEEIETTDYAELIVQSRQAYEMMLSAWKWEQNLKKEQIDLIL